jgi:glycosyltransferase involved in cell wall biosynthesis
MKVLIIDNSLDTTGASKALNKMIIEIASPEYEFVFVYPRSSKNIRIVSELSFKVYSLPFKEISKSPVNLILYFPVLLLNTWRLARIIKKEKIDLVHVNDIFNMLGLTVKLFTGKKLITHIRRMPESFPLALYRIWARLHVRFANKIIAVSESNKEALPRNNKTVVVYDPLPEAEHLPSYKIKKELKRQANIIYLANYTLGKGQLYGIEILERATKELPEWQFTLNYYGGDFGLEKNRQLKAHLEKITIEKGLSKQIYFHDKSDEVEREMKAHDLVFNLSDSESFSRVTLESLFYGIPIVATDVGGTKEMMPAHYRSLLGKPKNVDSMYEKFRQLILDDSFRRAYADACYHFVRENFGLQETSMQLRQIYHATLNI